MEGASGAEVFVDFFDYFFGLFESFYGVGDGLGLVLRELNSEEFVVLGDDVVDGLYGFFSLCIGGSFTNDIFWRSGWFGNLFEFFGFDEIFDVINDI